MNATFGLNSSSFYNYNSVTLAISAITDFGTVYITNPTPNSAAQNYINTQDWDGFINSYGDSYVTQISRGVSATLFLTISNLSSSQQSQLSGSISGQATGLGSAGVDFANAIESANASGNLNIQIAVNGASFAELSDLVTQARANTNALDSIKNAFADYMSGFTLSQAQVTGFTYAPMSNFGVSGTDELIDGKVIKLTAIYDHFYDIKGKESLLNSILNSEYYNDFHNQSDALEATRLASQYVEATDSLYTAYITCKEDPCANISTCCNNPVFVFNDAFFDKFLNLHFSNCIDVNLNWTESYANHTFTLVSTTRQTFNPISDFYNCISTNPSLAGNIITSSFGGTINGGNGFYPSDGIGFFEDINEHEYNYNWSIPYIPGDYPITHSYTDTVGADGIISLAVRYSASYGPLSNGPCDLLPGATVRMTFLNPIPDIEAIITPANTTICQGSSVTLMANNCNNCSYLWSTGQTTQSISATASGNYTVEVTDVVTGRNNTSYWATVVTKTPPVTPIISGPSIICEGSSASLTANSEDCIDCSYTWSLNNQNGSTLSTTVAGIYTVTANNGCNPNVTSLPFTLTVAQSPAIPIINITNEIYLSTPNVNGANYQWYLDGVLIQGETTRFYTASETGFYSVEITDINGCSSFSEDMFLTVGINESIVLGQIKIYPNPATNTLIVETDKTAKGIYQLHDVTGKLLLSGNVTATKFTIDISTLSKGIYLLSLIDGERQLNRKIVKE